MKIHVVKHMNKTENNRIEFLFQNFDFFDGNDLIAELFSKEYEMSASEKADGIFYSIIKLYKNNIEYELIWHEDVGNYMFSVNQDENIIEDLESKLKVIVNKLNEMIVN